MTGITGFLGTAENENVLASMLRKLSHRGGATEDFFNEQDVFIGFTAAEASRKPYIDTDQGVAVFLDGQIYNAAELRAKLRDKGIQFSLESDAELIAKIYQAYGTNLPKHLNGAFAFALYDFKSHMVMLCRDHMGVKPFYYTTTPSGAFVFGSEIKPILEHPGVTVSPDMMMIDAYLSLGFCPGPQSLFKGIHALPPGHSLIWNRGLHIHLENYWKWDGARSSDIITGKNIQEEFDRLFDSAVETRVREHEGNLGVILSPDIATQAIAVSSQKNAYKPVKSYSAHFRDDDESRASCESFAKRMGLYHETVAVQPSDISALPEIIWSLDQPVADPQVVSRYLLSRAAGHEVRGLLSAESSDDVMAGHALHKTLNNAYQKPKAYYGLIKHFAARAPLKSLDGLYSAFSAIGSGAIGERSRKRLVDFVTAMHKGDVNEQYLALAVIFNRREKDKFFGPDLQPFMETYNDRQQSTGIYAGFIDAIQGLERQQGVTDSIVNGFERIAGLSGLSVRLPYTDPALAGFMKAVPQDAKIRNGHSKVLLGNYLAKSAKGNISMAKDHPVKPFPFASFTSSPTLREMIGSCLSDDSIRRRGLFEQNAVKQVVAQAKEGDMLACRQVFSLLSLEMWFRIFVDHEKGWISH